MYFFSLWWNCQFVVGQFGLPQPCNNVRWDLQFDVFAFWNLQYDFAPAFGIFLKDRLHFDNNGSFFCSKNGTYKRGRNSFGLATSFNVC